MNGIAQYIFSVTAAAILISLLRPLLDGKGAAAAIGKMLGGVFLLFTILNPLTKVSIGGWEDLSSSLKSEASEAVAVGQAAAKKEMAAIITERVQTYILDKAASYDATLSVSVTLSEDTIPVPVKVTIRGSISPYGKRQLQSIIANDLGISKEDQIWI